MGATGEGGVTGLALPVNEHGMPDLTRYPAGFARPPRDHRERAGILRCLHRHNWSRWPRGDHRFFDPRRDLFVTDASCAECGRHWSRGANTRNPWHACTCGGPDRLCVRGSCPVIDPAAPAADRRRRLIPWRLTR